MSEKSTVDLIIEFLEVMTSNLKKLRDEKLEKQESNSNTLEIKVSEDIKTEDILR